MIKVKGDLWEQIDTADEGKAGKRWMLVLPDGSIVRVASAHEEPMLDALAEMDKEKSEWVVAFGIASTVAPYMVVDTKDPQKMAQEICQYVDGLAKTIMIMQNRLVNVFQDQVWVKENT